MIERKRTIVGFDPGTTSAIAVLDLDRNVLLMKSVRNAGFDEIVGEVSSVGKPVVVACDVSPAPEVVRKLAASFDAHLSVPEMSMEVEEKAKLARAFGPEDNHQRDSLAAALGCANRLNGLMEKARSKGGGGENWEDAFEKVLKGTQPNLSRREPPVTTTAQETKPRKNRLPLQLKLKVLEKDVRRLRMEIEGQKEMILALQGENSRLHMKLDFEKQNRVRAIRNARRFAAPNLASKIKTLGYLLERKDAALNAITSKLKELEGKEVMILPAGKEIGGVTFIPVISGGKAARDDGVVIFTENNDNGKKGNALDINEAGGKKIEEWALVPKDSLSRITKDRLVRMIDGYKKERTGQ